MGSRRKIPARRLNHARRTTRGAREEICSRIPEHKVLHGRSRLPLLPHSLRRYSLCCSDGREAIVASYDNYAATSAQTKSIKEVPSIEHLDQTSTRDNR